MVCLVSSTGNLRLRWVSLSPENRESLITGLDSHIMTKSSSSSAASDVKGRQQQQQPLDYHMLRLITMKGLLMMKPVYSQLPTTLQAALLEHVMIMMGRSPSRMAYILNRYDTALVAVFCSYFLL